MTAFGACLECGRQFRARSNKKFCGDRCREIHWKKNKKTEEIKSEKDLALLFQRAKARYANVVVLQKRLHEQLTILEQEVNRIVEATKKFELKEYEVDLSELGIT